jgi:hypothetical protein
VLGQNGLLKRRHSVIRGVERLMGLTNRFLKLIADTASENGKAEEGWEGEARRSILGMRGRVGCCGGDATGGRERVGGWAQF